jgi:endonuclease/exonuclease/phosphatase family metal-dependent hydrolase
MAGQPKAAPEAGAARVKVATYNLAFTPELSSRTLSKRRPGVARQLVNSGASVIALSESVQIRGRSDTQLGPLIKRIRSEQRKTGKSAAWRFTRTTRYAKPGVLMGGDGTRILYNKKRVALLSSCSDITKVKKTVGKKVKRHGKIKKIKKKKTFKIPYSRSCTVKLPRVGTSIYQRWAPIVRFKDRKTGQRFWFVSAHLEVRKGEVFDRNRSSQLRSILRAIEQKNTRNEPVIIAGDLNLSANRTPDLSTLNSRLTRGGFVSSVTASIARNLQYQTFNGWKAQAAAKWGYAGRLDHVYARGRVYFSDYETVLGRASDHNLVRTTAWLK